jgi:hypothetical protein
VAAFFEPSIQCIAETVEEMVKPEAHTSSKVRTTISISPVYGLTEVMCPHFTRQGMKWIAGAAKKVLKSGARKITVSAETALPDQYRS